VLATTRDKAWVCRSIREPYLRRFSPEHHALELDNLCTQRFAQ
jgi:hypothetical protein